jgi:hypothetical protein
MVVYRCDLCNETRDCLQKEIDGREYDICAECWTALESKLKGKGRPKMRRESILLPPPRLPVDKECEQRRPAPGEPPKIWGTGARPN